MYIKRTILEAGSRRTADDRTPPRRARGGFTLVEILLGSVVLVIAILGTMSSITSSAILGDASVETTVAYEAAQTQLERLRATNFRSVFAMFNTPGSDDPLGAGTAPGADFVVAGLDPQTADADGMAGRIVFPTEALTGTFLLETTVDDAMGMPRDLNADGTIDAADHSGDYFLLPVSVRVEWRGVSGNRTIQLNTILCER